MEETRPPRVLAIAGHDPSYDGVQGAGVDADREAIEAFGAEARCVVTAWTEQVDGKVRAVGGREPGAWLVEARAELADAAPPGHPGALAAIKTGLLPGAAHVRTLRRFIDELPPTLPVVVDPVIAASGGEPFLDANGVRALAEELLPRGVLLTPNLPEAARLVACLDGGDGGGWEALAEELCDDVDRRVEVASRLAAAGAGLVVLKGGHGAEDPVVDLIFDPVGGATAVTRPRAEGGMHGSGCRFASALAAGLAVGRDPRDAAEQAGAWVASRILEARRGRSGR